tara:strand:+ start:239 stop:532 length:294 start_codon:yes stop_codon:yes gene_type:complete
VAVYTFIKAFYCAFGSAAIHAIRVIAFGLQAIAALGVALSAYCLGAGPFRTNFISLLSRYAAQRPPSFEFDGFLPQPMPRPIKRIQSSSFPHHSSFS